MAVWNQVPSIKIVDQPPPVANASRPVWDLVVEDMKARDTIGRERYGVPLQTNNGRDGLVDAYQEILDLAVYLRQCIEERDQQARRYEESQKIGRPWPAPVVKPLPDRSALVAEVARLQARETELLERCGTLLEELRVTDRQQMVREFHAKMNQTIGETPAIPGDDVVRFRMRVITEEYFELLAATFGDVKDSENNYWQTYFGARENTILVAIGMAPININMPEFIDATVDLDYFVDGTRITFGVNVTPIWAEVHRANMTKLPTGKRGDGKVMKPPGWTPPDIAEELRKQGWVSK